MSKTTKWAVWAIIAVAVVAGIVLYVNRKPAAPGKYDQFAQCLAQKGAKFYGAFWCPHCQNQKKMFGSSAEYLPYVECSTPDGSAQTPVCTQNKIEGYPTWVFADNSRLTGEIPLETLAQKTGCSLPQ